MKTLQSVNVTYKADVYDKVTDKNIKLNDVKSKIEEISASVKERNTDTLLILKYGNYWVNTWKLFFKAVKRVNPSNSTGSQFWELTESFTTALI